MKSKSKRLARLTQQETKYIEALLVEYEAVIKNTIYNTLGASYKALGQDAVGELYLLMCEKVSIIQNHSCPKGWLVVAAKNVSRGLLKKQNRDSCNVPFDETNVKSSTPSVFETVVYDVWLENKAPERLIAMLTDKELEIYFKLYIEGKKAKDIAAELGVSVSTVRGVHKNLKDKMENAIKDNKI